VRVVAAVLLLAEADGVAEAFATPAPTATDPVAKPAFKPGAGTDSKSETPAGVVVPDEAPLAVPDEVPLPAVVPLPPDVPLVAEPEEAGDPPQACRRSAVMIERAEARRPTVFMLY
jgi:hypothetical protein